MLRFPVPREIGSAALFIIDDGTILLIRKFYGLDIVTWSENNLQIFWTLSDTDR